MKSDQSKRSVLIATAAASVGFFIAFLRCWGVPVRSAIRAKNASKVDGKKFIDVYQDEYNKSIYELSQVPINTYNKYKDLADFYHKKYER